jgi:hypothetical protein
MKCVIELIEKRQQHTHLEWVLIGVRQRLEEFNVRTREDIEDIADITKVRANTSRPDCVRPYSPEAGPIRLQIYLFL